MNYVGNILIACEYSGVVRDAFENAGWNAWSCDILETESEQTKKSDKHIRGDIMTVLYKSNFFKKDILNFPSSWDMMIGFPPCTYLSYAGGAHWNKSGRIEKRLQALDFFRKLWEAPIKHICIENPKGCASPVIAKYSQIIQPYYFGEHFFKTTCLWLKNLPLLEYRKENDLFGNKTMVDAKYYWVNSGATRLKNKDGFTPITDSKKRAKTFQSIANAMAEQWTEYFLTNKNNN